ncbi:MAG: hypothetical protein ACI4HQ_07400, partial [Acetatifactor sp.]
FFVLSEKNMLLRSKVRYNDRYDMNIGEPCEGFTAGRKVWIAAWREKAYKTRRWQQSSEMWRR